MLFKSRTTKNVRQRRFHVTIKQRAFFFIETIGLEPLRIVSSKCDVAYISGKATIHSCWFIIHWTIHNKLVLFKNITIKINFGINICCRLHLVEYYNSARWSPKNHFPAILFHYPLIHHLEMRQAFVSWADYLYWWLLWKNKAWKRFYFDCQHLILL